MTVRERPLCDCDEPCACYAEGYAAGKDKAYFEVVASLNGARPTPRAAPVSPRRGAGLPPESDDAPARSSPSLFELVEAWTLVLQRRFIQ